ncbi:MAG TPA: DUF5060 domain-containing protein [Phycisphaerae bacterium]|nr:DUF5060 domain-containing protein [Phycisphaerae bacterium]
MGGRNAGAGGRWVLALAVLLMLVLARKAHAADVVERWGIFEASFVGPADGNPFVNVTVSATFVRDGDAAAKKIEVPGFYDGAGTYRVRFMPGEEGTWKYVTHSNAAALEGKTGEFVCGKASVGDHGPVRVAHTFHFAYADGTPYVEMGTTSYYWVFQKETMQERTLATLRGSPFNKIRMFVMPVADSGVEGAGGVYPFPGSPPKGWDFTRYNPAFFQAIEKRVGELRDMGIEADLILFNIYDKGRWDYDRMGAENDDRYARYVVARLGAYRNVWWSLANEFDLGKTKTDADWDRLFQIVQASDPYGHLRSIHHSMRLYDYGKPWVTHASIQNGSAVEDFGRAELYRDVWNKPVVFDEVKYEGNLEQRWGQLTGQEMVERFWQGAIAGTYVGHSEALRDAKGGGPVWMDQGGVLKGESPARIGFLRKVLEAGPVEGIDPIDKWQDVHTAGKAGSYYLIYFGRESPTSWKFELPKAGLAAGMTFKVEVLDTWGMTVTPVAGEFSIVADGKYRYHATAAEGTAGAIPLPGKPYMALRITRVAGK